MSIESDPIIRRLAPLFFVVGVGVCALTGCFGENKENEGYPLTTHSVPETIAPNPTSSSSP